MQVHRLRQGLLREAGSQPLPRQVGSQAGEHLVVSLAFASGRHATLWRSLRLTTTPLSSVLAYNLRTAMNPENLVFTHRLGPDPHASGAKTEALENCPDLWQLADGNFAVIGIDITAQTKGLLPPTAGCGPDERVIWIPRRVLVGAKDVIPGS